MAEPSLECVVALLPQDSRVQPVGVFAVRQHKDSELSPAECLVSRGSHLSFTVRVLAIRESLTLAGPLENPNTFIQSTELGGNYFGNRHTADKSYTDVRRQTQFNSNFYALQWEVADLLFDVVGSLQCI